MACGPLKILYFSCHDILEYDDLKMFVDAGHIVFSIGAYTFPGQPLQTQFRPSIDKFYNNDLLEKFTSMGCHWANKTVIKEFCRLFDVIIINHYPEWLDVNEEALEGSQVVLRLVGQSNRAVEAGYRRLAGRAKIVRYSAREQINPEFVAADEIIYFGKDVSLFRDRIGDGVGLSLRNDFSVRDSLGTPRWQEWKRIASRVPVALYGRGNEDIDENNGLAPPEKLDELFSRSRFFLYIHTFPASYTLTLLEAMAARLPVIAPSATFANRNPPKAFLDNDLMWFPERYEVDAILGAGALTYDTVEEAIDLADELCRDEALQRQCGDACYERIEKLYSQDNATRQWDRFFERIL